eukprot:TRINITY_DN54654_c0_g1_i1.p1 TRINITY_DN54654_c0_g1~~TRINITY_DN54654_c0_g1_i1.p1  ORF type:complete len:1037 (-),score=94.98 TRINITY_DN54654_c0_g1_i1:165-3275(-)
MRLFCAPPFGCGRRHFEHWTGMANAEIWMLGDASIGDWPRLLDALSAEVARVCDDGKPFVILGHSFGSILAFEVALRLEQRYGLCPLRVCVSQCYAPPVGHRMGYTLPFSIGLDLGGFDPDRMERFKHEAVEAGVLPPPQSGILSLSDRHIWNGILLVCSYRWSQKAIGSPVVALFADNDLLMQDPNSLIKWEQCTRGPFHIQHINGTHMWHLMRIPNWLERRITGPSIPYGKLGQVYQLKRVVRGTPSTSTSVQGAKPLGFLIYTDGCMMAQLWSLPRLLGPVEEMASSLAAYCGTFEHDPQKRRVRHHVTNSVMANHCGDVWDRWVSFEDDQLILTTAPATRKYRKPEAHMILSWTPVATRDCGVEWSRLSGAWTSQECGASMVSFTQSGHMVLQLYDPTRPEVDENYLLRADPGQLAAAWNSCLCIVASYQRTSAGTFTLELLEASRPAFGWVRGAEFEIGFESDHPSRRAGAAAVERIAWLESQLALESRSLQTTRDSAAHERIELLQQELDRLTGEVRKRADEAHSQLTLQIGTTAVVFHRGPFSAEDWDGPGASQVSRLLADSLDDSIQLVPVQPTTGEDLLSPVPHQIVGSDSAQVVTVESIEDLIRVVDSTRGIRVVGSGWSWSRVLVPKPGCASVKLGGCFSSMTVDPELLTSRVGAGLKICAWVSQVAAMGMDLEWAPKGYCYGSFDSQTFGGFVANNVHHSWCNTSYHDVLSAEVLVFQEVKPVVLVCSRDNHSDLFESIFGGSGFTGIILWLTIMVRPTTIWVREIDAQRSPSLTIPQVRRVMEPGAYVTIDCGDGEMCVTTVKVTQTTAKQEAPGLFDMNYFLTIGPLNYLRSMSQQALHLVLPPTDYHTANSWMIDRAAFGTPDTALIMTESTDITLYLELPHLDLVADAVGSVVSRGQSALDWEADDTVGFTVRYVSKGGGIFAFNADSDMIGVECTGTGSTGSGLAFQHATALMSYFWGRGIRVRLHPGKTFPGKHECFREALPAEKRAEAREVLQAYDRSGFFDCGELGIDDFYELQSD